MGDSTKQVGVEITADGTQFVKAMQGCVSAVEHAQGQIKAQLASIGGAFDAIQKHVLALTAVIAGGKAFKAVINDSANSD